MANTTDPIKLLLIEQNSNKGELVREALEDSRINCSFRSITEGKSAVAYLKRVEPYKEEPVPDIVLFDFSDPDESSLDLLRSLTNEAAPVKTPVVLLTSRSSEPLLDTASQDRSNLSCFAPIDLSSFLSRVGELRKERFLSAISLMSNLGLILVRLPTAMLQRSHRERRALIA